MKKNSFLNLLVSSIVGVLIGVLFLLIPVDTLLWLMFVILGIVIIASSLPVFLEEITSNNKNMYALVSSTIAIVLGVLLIIVQNTTLMIIIGIYLIAVPIYNIVVSKYKVEQLKVELPKLIIGVLLIVFGPATLTEALFTIVGWVIIVLSVLGLGYSLIKKVK